MKKIMFFLCLFTSMAFSVPLPADQAFKLSVTQPNAQTVWFTWTLQSGYFLYKDRIQFRETNPQLATFLPESFPPALQKTDHQGRTIDIYRKKLTLPITLAPNQPKDPSLIVTYQGCSDLGYCYPPIERTVHLHELLVPSTPQHTFSWFKLLSFYGFGLLLAFTPCVLPMIPILSGIIVGHGQAASTRKAFFLSLSYVLSMSVTYSVIGGLIALMGQNLQVIMQAPAFIWFFSGICVLLALSMFDVYELKLPVLFQRYLANITRHQSGGHYLSAAIMGALSILILSPCVTAPMIGALSYIAQKGNALFGFLALFSLGLGMGTPLLLIGTSAGRLLPKAGHWMIAIKHLFGFLFLAVALHLVAHLLPAPLHMALWAGLWMFISLSLQPFEHAKTFWGTTRQSLGMLIFVYSLLVLLGGSLGHNNPWLPLAQSTSKHPTSFKQTLVRSPSELKQALSQAKGYPIFIDFYADWCASCQWIQHTLLQEALIKTALKPYVIITVDVTQSNANSHALLEDYQVIAPPTLLFFDAQGHEKTSLRLVGEPSIQTLLEHLNAK